MNALDDVATWVPKSIDDVKAAYGFPADAVFRGYLVHLPESDEFLVSVQKFPRKWSRPSGVGRVWTQYPHIAKVFHDHRSALFAARGCDNQTARIVHLFETADQLLVSFDG